MRNKWTQAQYTIADVLEWSKAYRLELQPGYQRKDVWSAHARIMLIDTIIRDLPMPKIFASLSKGKMAPHCQIIDGQQRISAILGFLKDKFSLDYPYTNKEQGKKFSELEQELQNRILSYSLDFDIVSGLSDQEIRDTYLRLNKYTVQLNKQELRLADYPGDFLDTARELADCSYFESINIFSILDRRRHLDVEYTSELLAAMLQGIQDEDRDLDSFYQNYTDWKDKEWVKKQFKKTLNEFEILFNNFHCHISITRFKEKANFYTLFLTINDFVEDGKTIEGKEVSELLNDFVLLDKNISLESPIELCKEYAIKCIHLPDTLNNRKWRSDFMKLILNGTFSNQPPNDMRVAFYKLAEDIYFDHSLLSVKELYCAICSNIIEINVIDLHKCTLVWPAETSNFQISNIHWVHTDCTDKANGWIVLERYNN